MKQHTNKVFKEFVRQIEENIDLHGECAFQIRESESPDGSMYFYPSYTNGKSGEDILLYKGGESAGAFNTFDDAATIILFGGYEKNVKLVSYDDHYFVMKLTKLSVH